MFDQRPSGEEAQSFQYDATNALTFMRAQRIHKVRNRRVSREARSLTLLTDAAGPVQSIV